jgi:hypothetical protein
MLAAVFPADAHGHLTGFQEITLREVCSSLLLVSC